MTDPSFDVFDQTPLQQTISERIVSSHSPQHFRESFPGVLKWSIPPSAVSPLNFLTVLYYDFLSLSQRYWTDTQFKLLMVFEVKKKVKGTDMAIDKDDIVAPVNNFLNSYVNYYPLSLIIITLL